MIRAFLNGERIATARKNTYNDGIFQVYPEKQAFESLDAWKAKYEGEGIEFKEETAEDRIKLWAHKQVQAGLYKEVSTDNELQKTVRRLYAQLGLPDSILKRKNTDENHYIVLRKEPHLYALVPQKGCIYPVHFSSVKGHISIGFGKVQLETADGLIFFFKKYEGSSEMIVVTPQYQTKVPGQKTIIYIARPITNETDRYALRQLIDAGFYVQYFNYKRYLDFDIRNALYEIPDVKAVVGGSYSQYSLCFHKKGSSGYEEVNIDKFLMQMKLQEK